MNTKSTNSIITNFVNTYGFVVKPVRDIFELCGLVEKDCKGENLQLHITDANELAQNELKRPEGERWQEPKLTKTKLQALQQVDKIMEILKDKLHFFDAIEPVIKKVTYAGIYGSLLRSTVDRMDYLAQKMQEGFQIDSLVLFGGDRPLRDDEKEYFSSDRSAFSPKTECDMMKYLADNHSAFKNIPIITVNALGKRNPDGTYARPTTDDTLRQFVLDADAHQYPDGPMVVVSNGYYGLRQLLVAQDILPQNRFPTHCMASAADILAHNPYGLLGILDEFARTIYQINKVTKP